MTELTTGVIFLMSSMYGSGQSNVHVANIANAQNPVTDKTNIETQADDAVIAKISDAKTMEAYLRKEYADTPILVEIARCESSFRQFDKDGKPIRGEKNKADIGVMQINEVYHAETAKILKMDIHTLEGNVAYAKHLYEEQGSKPWSASKKCWGTSNQVARSN